MFAPGRGAAARARRRRARLPEGRPGLHRRLERQQRPVRARLPGGRQRPLVHHRRDGRRRDRRSAQTGGARRHRLAGPQAYNGAGAPASSAWPKLTGGWTVATPDARLAGHDRHGLDAPRRTSSRSRAKARCRSTRRPPSACSPSSWPNFHHDIANSGDYTRDAVPPGEPLNASVAENDAALDRARRRPAVRQGDALSKSSPPKARSRPRTSPQRRRSAALPPRPRPGTAQTYTLPAERRELRGDPRDRRAGQHRPAGRRPNTTPGRRCRRSARCVKAP